jgi:hypothetical protein
MAAMCERSTSERRVVLLEKARGGQASNVRGTTTIGVEEGDLVRTQQCGGAEDAGDASLKARPSPSPRKRPAHARCRSRLANRRAVPLWPTQE